MRKADVVSYFGGKQRDVVRALGISKGAVSQWGELVPKCVALELQFLTEGKLKYDPTMYGSRDRGELALGPEE